MQREVFPEEYSALLKEKKLPTQSKLLGLSPRLDEDKIMRSDGRLKYAEFLPYNMCYPIILPFKNWVTKLIVKYHHELGNHAGTNQTLSLCHQSTGLLLQEKRSLNGKSNMQFVKEGRQKMLSRSWHHYL